MEWQCLISVGSTFRLFLDSTKRWGKSLRKKKRVKVERIKKKKKITIFCKYKEYKSKTTVSTKPNDIMLSYQQDDHIHDAVCIVNIEYTT